MVKDKFITFTQAPNGTDFQLDTEDGNIIELLISNETGILIEKGEGIILFWNNFESSFYLLSNIGHKDIVRIAESIEKK